MGVLKLIPDPTFSAVVQIPVAGGEPAAVRFSFRHRTRAELQQFVREAADRSEAANVLEMCTGWDLVDAWSPANVETLVANYLGAGRAVFEAYLSELVQARQGN